MKKILLAAALALLLVGCGTETKTKYVDVEKIVEVEVPVEKIVEVEVPVDVYVYQDYTGQINFGDLRVDINCQDGNCTANILEYNCYPSEFSGGPACNCDFYPVESYVAEVQCVEPCTTCPTSSSSEAEVVTSSSSSEATSSSSSEASSSSECVVSSSSEASSSSSSNGGLTWCDKHPTNKHCHKKCKNKCHKPNGKCKPHKYQHRG